EEVVASYTYELHLEALVYIAAGWVIDSALYNVSAAGSARARIRIHAPHLRLRVGRKNRVEHQQAGKRKRTLQSMHLPDSENHFRFLLNQKNWSERTASHHRSFIEGTAT